MITALVSKCFLEGRDEGIVTSSETACTNDVHIVINRLSSDFFGGHEKTANIYIEAKISESTSDNFSTTIVAILAHFSDKNTWVATFSLRECLHVFHSLLVLKLALSIGILKRLFTISTSYDRVLCDMTTEDFFEGHADFTNCSSLSCCLNR